MGKGSYTKILAAHEIRMWLGQVIIPAIIGGAYIGYLIYYHVKEKKEERNDV